MEKEHSKEKEQLLEETLPPCEHASETARQSTSMLSVCDTCGLEFSPSTSSAETKPSTSSAETKGSTIDWTSSNVSQVTSYMSILGIEKKSFFSEDLYPKVLRSVSFAQLSKRPLICPATKCRKLFAITQIINHIVYEHMKVPSSITSVYEETIVDFDVNKISMGETVVLALLAIPRDMTQEPGLINNHLDNSFVFLIFAANQPLSSEQKNKGSLINIWVSGYVDNIFSCMVEVYSDDRSISYNFHGAVNSLRESHDSSDVLERAECLLLHPASIDKMRQNENKPLKLKVIIGCKSVQD